MIVVNPSYYPSNWRKVSATIRRLANGHCQRCGIESKRLSVHHIGVPYADGRPGDPRDKHDLRRENLICLCHDCHNEIDEGQKRYIKMMSKRQRKLERHRALGLGTGLVLYERSSIILAKLYVEGVC